MHVCLQMVYQEYIIIPLIFFAATRHYQRTFIPFYFPGDPIEIPTVDDDVLERSRQFEVRITNSSSNPLNILEPNRVIITIRDNDGKF